MKHIEDILEKFARLQAKHYITIIVATIIISAIMAYGATQIKFSGDFSSEMPQELPIFVLNNKITDKFAGQDVIFILLSIDDSLADKDTPTDIRDRHIMQYVVDLEDSLNKESSVEKVVSISPLIKAVGSETNEDILGGLKTYPSFESLLSKDYKQTIMMVYSDVGKGQDRILKLTRLIEEKIDANGAPAGVDIKITGSPNIIATVLDLLRQDSVYTLIVASIIIMVLLVIMQRSFLRGLLIFLPIIIGILWTMGTMGYLNIKISVATAGLGAMILGLGVEYGVFILLRYREETDKGKNEEQSLKIAVPAVGSSIVGSGTTTIVGFLALTLSVMPLLQNLGKSLALGIFFCIISAVVIEPPMIVASEKMLKRLKKKNEST